MTTGKKLTIFVDLDGVLADFVRELSHVLSVVTGSPFAYSEARYERDAKYRKLIWNSIEEYQTKHGGRVWEELKLMPDAMKLWKFLRDHFDHVEILSATGKPSYNAEEQKIRWVHKHFGSDIKINLVRKAEEKAKFACNHCVLIDDKLKAISPWRAAGGIGILHTSASETIAQLSKLLEKGA